MKCHSCNTILTSVDLMDSNLSEDYYMCPDCSHIQNAVTLVCTICGQDSHNIDGHIIDGNYVTICENCIVAYHTSPQHCGFKIDEKHRVYYDVIRGKLFQIRSPFEFGMVNIGGFCRFYNDAITTLHSDVITESYVNNYCVLIDKNTVDKFCTLVDISKYMGDDELGGYYVYICDDGGGVL